MEVARAELSYITLPMNFGRSLARDNVAPGVSENVTIDPATTDGKTSVRTTRTECRPAAPRCAAPPARARDTLEAG